MGPENMGQEIVQGIPGMNQLQALLALLGQLGGQMPAPGAAPQQMAPNPLSGVQSGLKAAMMGGMQGQPMPRRGQTY